MLPCVLTVQVDNATAYLVTLNAQLVGLSGNATVLTSKAPGEGRQEATTGQGRGWSSRFVSDPPSCHYCPHRLFTALATANQPSSSCSQSHSPPSCPSVLTRALRSLNMSAADAAQIESAITSLPARVDSIARSVNSGRRTLEENVAGVGAAWLDLWG